MAEVLGPDERREIDRLRRALTLGEGPELHLIVGDTRRVVDAALAEVLPGVEPPHETVAPEEAPKAFAVRWTKWLEAAVREGGARAVVLDAWDVDPEHIEHWGWIFARLNERRNEIMRGLGRPLLLLLSPDNERLLGHTAPDLWSIRGVGMRLHDRGRLETDEDVHDGVRLPTSISESPRLGPPTREAVSEVIEGIVTELAHLVYDSERARMLALQAGLPPTNLPAFSSALSFWHRVVVAAHDGAIVGGLDSLLRATTRQYPHNAVLRGYLDRLTATGRHIPSVFVSYSNDSDEHAAQVRSFADRLRGDGLDVRLDQYVPHPLEGWSEWVKRQVTEVDFVVFVCTAGYRRRFEDETLGAPESALARQLFYAGRDRKTGLVPVLLGGTTADDIPRALRSRTFYVLPEDYDRLYRRMTELSNHSRWSG